MKAYRKSKKTKINQFHLYLTDMSKNYNFFLLKKKLNLMKISFD